MSILSDPRADESLILCEHCDAAYVREPLTEVQIAYCTRCGSELYRDADRHYRCLLPVVVASLIVFVVCNVYPIVTMEIQGVRADTTLWQAVRVMADDGMVSVSALVFATTIFFPLAELLMMLYLLLPLAMGRVPPAFGPVVRAVRLGRPWGMIEVLLLGIIAALVKLTTLAEVIPGRGLWSFAVLTVLLALVLRYDPRLLWDQARRVAVTP